MLPLHVEDDPKKGPKHSLLLKRILTRYKCLYLLCSALISPIPSRLLIFDISEPFLFLLILYMYIIEIRIPA